MQTTLGTWPQQANSSLRLPLQSLFPLEIAASTASVCVLSFPVSLPLLALVLGHQGASVSITCDRF